MGSILRKNLKKKFTATDTYNLLKSVANQQEKKEFRDIERKYKKKKPIAQRTEPFSNKDDTGAAVKIDIAPFPFENTITHTYGAIEDAKVVRFPSFISPIDNRAQGGGYQKFDVNNPDTVAELCRQASRELNSWIKRHEGICTLKNIDIESLSEVADSLESESISSEAS